MISRTAISVACAAALLAGCSTTTLDRTEVKRGALLQSTTGDFRLIDEKLVLDIRETSVQVNNRQIFEQRNEKTYQVIEQRHYTTESVRAFATTGLVLLCIPGGLMTFGMLWYDCGVPITTTKYHHADVTIPDKRDIESTVKSRTETVAVANSPVDIFVANTKAMSGLSNSQGQVQYALDRLLIAASITPQQVIHGDGVEVRATSNGVSASYRFPNKAIPESYFSDAYETEKTTLQEANRARHDNCSLVSRNMREFYECYFQRNLLGG